MSLVSNGLGFNPFNLCNYPVLFDVMNCSSYYSINTPAAETRLSPSAPQTETTERTWTPEMQAAVDAQRILDAATAARVAAAGGDLQPVSPEPPPPLTCSLLQSATGGECVTNWAMVGLLGAGALVLILALRRQ